VGCSAAFTSGPFKGTSVGEEKVYFLSSQVESSYAYKLYKGQYPDELAKIRYLLNLIRHSENIFIRNKEAFSGARAARWIEFKLYKYPDEASTAIDFVKNLASHSKKTKKPYRVVLNDGSRISLYSVLINELKRLEEFEGNLEKKEVPSEPKDQNPPELAEEPASSVEAPAIENIAAMPVVEGLDSNEALVNNPSYTAAENNPNYQPA